jgi:hypothetical protein
MCSRGSVLRYHTEDQLTHFYQCRSSSAARPDSRDQPPVRTKTSLVPTDYGFGRDDGRDCFHSDQTQRAATQKSVSHGLRPGRGWHLFHTTSDWHNGRFSRRRLRPAPRRQTTISKLNAIHGSMARSQNRTVVRQRQLCHSFHRRPEFWRTTACVGAENAPPFSERRSRAIILFWVML